MSYLEVSELSKTFSRREGSAERITVVQALSLAVRQGEMLALLGASGSGKTTLLRCVGGLETPDAGEISVAGQSLFSQVRGINVPPHKRNMGMVFQSYALWPHMTVSQNIGYPLVRRGVAPRESESRIREYLQLVDCEPYAERYPHQLSGGQQQRVALARALVAEPNLVLFDEPLSNLDANLREQLRFQIRNIKRRLGFTGIYVTHDHAEAVFIADRIAIIGGGRLLQLGTAEELYASPADREVAEFLGFTNMLDGQLASTPEGWRFNADGAAVPIDAARIPPLAPQRAPMLMCHPSRVRIVERSGASLHGKVVDVVRVSDASDQYVIELPGGRMWQCVEGTMGKQDIGNSVHLEVLSQHIHLFEA